MGNAAGCCATRNQDQNNPDNRPKKKEKGKGGLPTSDSTKPSGKSSVIESQRSSIDTEGHEELIKKSQTVNHQSMKQKSHAVGIENKEDMRRTQDVDDDKGNMLANLDNDDMSYDFGDEEDKKEDESEMVFGMGDNPQNTLKRTTSLFDIAKTRKLNAVNIADYLMNPLKRKNEDPLQSAGPQDFKQALFYMYGACEGVDGDRLIAHNLLKRHGIWDGSDKQAKKYLKNQKICALKEDDEQNLTEIDNILKFLKNHSVCGKNIHEIEEIGETVSCTLYKVVDSTEEFVIKVPKKVEDGDCFAFLDQIYQTQLMQFLQHGNQDSDRKFFPDVKEEIFVINNETRTILNYVSIVDFPPFSLINMLDGPTAGQFKEKDLDEEGYRSQELFTEEKFAYLYFKGIVLLEFLYDNGMTHGHINANSLRINDQYELTLSDFPIANFIPDLAKQSPEEQSEHKLQVRGFNKTTVSDTLQRKLSTLIESHRSDVTLEDQEDKGFNHEFKVTELIMEDWRDMVATFFFPKLSKCLTDQRIRTWIDNTNRELLDPDQEPEQIKNIAQKARRFLTGNVWILENLIDNLKEEQMDDAVDAIGQELYQLGQQMDQARLQAFSQLIIGEIAANEHIENEKRANNGIELLLKANQLYQEDAQILSGEEFSRLCLSLSKLYSQSKKDSSQAKRWLEMAKDKITDKRVLFDFYRETARQLTAEGKHYQALDSNKKAMDLAPQFLGFNEYGMFELQITLAENYEACEEREKAEDIFNECFKNMDGRDGASQYSRGMSIRSKLSRALSIKSKNSTMVRLRQGSLRSNKGGQESQSATQEKAGAMQRVAVQLRQKQEYNRAERLMIQAINVKKKLLGSEVNEDIAYLYNELAVTYHGNDDFENAAKCVKKQLAIWDALKQNNTIEYAGCLFFLGELQRDLELPAESIESLSKGIALHEQITEKSPAEEGNISSVSGVGAQQFILERSDYMKMLAEEQIKNGQLSEGVRSARGALLLQKQFFAGMINQQVQETMLLLAEALIVSGENTEALQLYQDVLDANSDGFGSRVGGDNSKDIYRKMAAILQEQESYSEAAECLNKVIKLEDKEILKVGLITKLTGNLKKAGRKDECIEASKQAYELMKKLSSETDPQTCRCKLNLAQVHQHFEDNEEAKALYQEYLDMFGEHTGAEAVVDWEQEPAYTKLRDFAQAAIAEIDGTGDEEGEEEYYDEEEPEEGKEKGEDEAEAEGDEEENKKEEATE